MLITLETTLRSRGEVLGCYLLNMQMEFPPPCKPLTFLKFVSFPSSPPLTPLALCLVYYPFKLHTPIRERGKVAQGEQRKLRPFKVHLWRLFMNLTNGVKNKCERIFQERNMLLQFAGSFPLRSRKAASPLLTREARRPGGKGNQGIKTGLPPRPCASST